MKQRITVSVALAALLTLSACGGGGGGGGGNPAVSAPQASLSESAALAQFDTMWNTFDRNYVYFKLKHVDWDAARTSYRGRAGQARDQAVLNTVLLEMLGILHDQHVRLFTNDGKTSYASFAPAIDTNWNKDVWLSYVQRFGWVQQAPELGSAPVPGGAYMAVGSWATGNFTAADIDAVLERVKSSAALILDVRLNSGGSDALAAALALRLTPAAGVAGYYQERNGPGHGDLTALTPELIAPAGPWQYTKPILLLVGRASASTNESFIAYLRSLPNVTVIGDVTAGTSGNPMTYPLSEQWSFSVSSTIKYGPDHAVIEGVGLTPSVLVPASAANFAAGVDPVLDYALARLKNAR